MAKIIYEGIGITAVSACVPKKISSNYDMDYIMSKE